MEGTYRGECGMHVETIQRSNIHEIGILEREEREHTLKSRYGKKNQNKKKYEEAHHLISAFRFSVL